MGIHSKHLIKKLSSQLDERLEKLKTVMAGCEPNSYEVSSCPTPNSLTKVNPSEIRVSVDDFNTILKEIKRVLK